MATYTGWFYRDDQPTQEIQFEASADLRNDKEELEQIMRAELRKRFSKSEDLNIEDIAICYRIVQKKLNFATTD